MQNGCSDGTKMNKTPTLILDRVPVPVPARLEGGEIKAEMQTTTRKRRISFGNDSEDIEINL